MFLHHTRRLILPSLAVPEVGILLEGAAAQAVFWHQLLF